MSMKDAVGNGNSAMKEAAMRSLGVEAAVSTELRTSARRTERADRRREPCMLNDRSSAKVGLEPEGIGTELDVRAVRAGSTAGLKAGSPIACATWHAAPVVCGDPEPILTDLLSHG